MTATSALLLLGDQLEARERGGELSMSGVGGCRKRAGFQIHGYEPDNEVSSVVAALGSAAHRTINAAVAALNREGDLTEVPVEYAGMTGHIDRYEKYDRLRDGSLVEAHRVVDVKTTSARWLESIQIHGIPESHRFQTALYGAALIQGGTPVSTLRIDYIVRDTGQEWQAERHFSVKEVREALEWVKFVTESPFDLLPRDYEPESTICASCPFFNKCWEGYVPDRDKRSVMLAEGAKPALLAEELFLLRKQMSSMTKRANELRGALDGLRPDDPMVIVQAGSWYIKWTAGDLEGKGQQLRFTAPPQEREREVL